MVSSQRDDFHFLKSLYLCLCCCVKLKLWLRCCGISRRATEDLLPPLRCKYYSGFRKRGYCFVDDIFLTVDKLRGFALVFYVYFTVGLTIFLLNTLKIIQNNWCLVATEALEDIIWASLSFRSTSDEFEVELFEWKICKSIEVCFYRALLCCCGFRRSSICLAINQVNAKINILVLLKLVLWAYCVAPV